MDEPTDVQNLITRVGRLEREGRLWKALGGGAVGLLGLMLLVGATGREQTKVRDEIRAHRFMLVDEEGNLRASLATGAGLTGFSMYDRSDTMRTLLAIGDTGEPHLTLFAPAHGTSSSSQITLRMTGDSPSLLFHDERGTPRIGLVLDDDQALLQFNNRGGEKRLFLGIPKGGMKPGIFFLKSDNEGGLRWPPND